MEKIFEQLADHDKQSKGVLDKLRWSLVDDLVCKEMDLRKGLKSANFSSRSLAELTYIADELGEAANKLADSLHMTVALEEHRKALMG